MLRIGYAGLCVVFLACGGKAVIDAPLGAGGSSASGGATTTEAASSTDVATTNATGGAVVDCRQSGCPDGQVCHQASGVCIARCDTATAACGSGTKCDPCPTASCPTCMDCVAGCMPSGGTKLCNDHLDCAATDVCIFSSSQCAKRCGTGDPADVCPSGVCLQCLTSSCATCEDCVSACTETTPG